MLAFFVFLKWGVVTIFLIIILGTLDAVCVDGERGTIEKVNVMFAEISRVLKSNGRYICISLSQEHVLNQLIAAHSQGWITRVHVIKVAGEQVGVASSLPVFTFVMTKMATPAIQVRTKSLKHSLNLFLPLYYVDI